MKLLYTLSTCMLLTCVLLFLWDSYHYPSPKRKLSRKSIDPFDTTFNHGYLDNLIQNLRNLKDHRIKQAEKERRIQTEKNTSKDIVKQINLNWNTGPVFFDYSRYDSTGSFNISRNGVVNHLIVNEGEFGLVNEGSVITLTEESFRLSGTTDETIILLATSYDDNFHLPFAKGSISVITLIDPDGYDLTLYWRN